MCIQNRCPALYLLTQLQNSNKVFVGSSMSIILAMAIVYSLGGKSNGMSTTTFGCSSERALMRLEVIAFTPCDLSRSTRHFDVAIFFIFVDCKRLATDFTGAACACSSMAASVQHNDDEGDEVEAARREWNSRRNSTACSYFSSPTSCWRVIVEGTMVMQLLCGAEELK